jgi:uncharacterized protein YggE
MKKMYPNYFNYNAENYKSLSDKKKLKVFGQGIVNVKPDMAEVVIGVVTEALKLEAAQAENAKITEQVIENIKKQGVAPKDIQTQNYSINMKYDYVEGKQVFKGYVVNNSLKVLIRNINNVGNVIDSAVEGGANSINNINFIVSDTSRYYNLALKLAVKDAQNKAMTIADKLNVNISIIPIQIVEQPSTAAVPLMTASYKTAAAVPPIEAGENKIAANIEAVFSYYE